MLRQVPEGSVSAWMSGSDTIVVLLKELEANKSSWNAETSWSRVNQVETISRRIPSSTCLEKNRHHQLLANDL